jgi:hypothetical protein
MITMNKRRTSINYWRAIYKGGENNDDGDDEDGEEEVTVDKTHWPAIPQYVTVPQNPWKRFCYHSSWRQQQKPATRKNNTISSLSHKNAPVALHQQRQVHVVPVSAHDFSNIMNDNNINSKPMASSVPVPDHQQHVSGQATIAAAAAGTRGGDGIVVMPTPRQNMEMVSSLCDRSTISSSSASSLTMGSVVSMSASPKKNKTTDNDNL